jgi:hypothetical protein
MTNNNFKIVKEIVSRELLDFRRFQVDVKYIKNPPQWWEKHESKFNIVGFLAKQMVGIIGSEIEIEHIFSLVGILTCIRKYQLQSEILDKLISINQIWPNDPRVGCNMPSTLVEFIEKHEIVKELEEFEREKIVNMNSLY